jgi:hypothetical protein
VGLNGGTLARRRRAKSGIGLSARSTKKGIASGSEFILSREAFILSRTPPLRPSRLIVARVSGAGLA